MGSRREADVSTCDAAPKDEPRLPDALAKRFEKPNPIEPAALPASESLSRAEREVMRGKGFRAGFRGWPTTPEICSSAVSLRHYERGLAMRHAAIVLGVWYPGCGVSVSQDVRREARRAAAAVVARTPAAARSVTVAARRDARTTRGSAPVGGDAALTP